jgi:uncharacterized peroxidase-related enzyme
MSRIALVEPATATGRAAELLAAAQQAFGTTPNMTKVMAASPAVLEGYLALSGALGTGTLPAAVRERLALSTAEANGCSYCLSAHTYIGSALAKVDPAELESARHGTSSDPHTAALLRLSNAVLETRGAVSDDVLADARAHGATDAEIAEVVGHIALNVLTNYLNVLSDVEIDWPLVAVDRPAA